MANIYIFVMYWGVYINKTPEMTFSLFSYVTKMSADLHETYLPVKMTKLL